MKQSTDLSSPERNELCISTLRFLAVDMVQKANSGHPGISLGSAAMAYGLWDRVFKFNPRDPLWADRDRFVLSAGHGSALLHVTGFDLTLDELTKFRQFGSRTPGLRNMARHPASKPPQVPWGKAWPSRTMHRFRFKGHM